MKRIASIVVVAVALFGTAIYFASVPSEASSDTPTTRPASTAPAPTPDPPEDPKTRADVSGTLRLEAESSHGYLPKGESDRIYTAIDVKAGSFEKGTRPPLNIALVMDRSGSMGGRKLEHAKAAARTIVDKLQSDDRLALITYEARSNVRVAATEMNGAGKDRMRREIREIRDGGGTNIGAAMRQGLGALRRTGSEESINRMILLSDGKPTVGLTSTNRLSANSERALERGVSVTTMGIGLDYNEDLMAEVANLGGGNYYFIDEPSKAPAIFDEELAGLAKTVAKGASLVVELGDAVELESVRGYPADTSDGRVRVSLSEFFADQNKSVLLEMSGRFGADVPERVVDVQLSYEDLVEDRQAHQSATLTAAATEDEAQVEASINKSVISRVQQVEVASALETAMGEFEKGNEQRARKVLRKHKRKLRQAQKSHDLSAGAMEPMKRQLDQAEKGVGSASASSDRGKKIIKDTKEESNLMELDSTR